MANANFRPDGRGYMKTTRKLKRTPTGNALTTKIELGGRLYSIMVSTTPGTTSERFGSKSFDGILSVSFPEGGGPAPNRSNHYNSFRPMNGGY